MSEEKCHKCGGAMPWGSVELAHTVYCHKCFEKAMSEEENDRLCRKEMAECHECKACELTPLHSLKR